MRPMSISQTIQGLPDLSVTMKTAEPLEPTAPTVPITPQTPKTPAMKQQYSGKTLDSYINLKKLGQGAFGSVFKVRDKQTGRIMALKVIKIKNEKMLMNTQKEVNNLMKISQPCHPYLACYYGSYYDPVRREFLIEMEFIDGPELGKWAKEFRKTVSNSIYLGYLLGILLKLLSGLRYVHSTGLIHRDIKPANIIMAKVGNEYVPKLVDFGIACETKSCSLLGKKYYYNCCHGRAGTPVFMPPETIQSSQSFPVSDIWSLGVTIFTLVNNKYPFYFASDEIPLILSTISANDPAKLTTTNFKLNDAVNSMLVKDPLQRINTDQLLYLIEN